MSTVSHKCSDICDGWNFLDFVNVNLQKALPFQQCAGKTAYFVTHFSVASLIFGLLFQNIVMKVFMKRLPEVCHSYCDIFDASILLYVSLYKVVPF